MIKIHLESGSGSGLLYLVGPVKKHYKVEAVKCESLKFVPRGKLEIEKKSEINDKSPPSSEWALFICVMQYSNA